MFKKASGTTSTSSPSEWPRSRLADISVAAGCTRACVGRDDFIPTSVPFTISFPQDQFDLQRTIYSGQVFRWATLKEGRWQGVDGGHWYRVTQRQPGTYEVETNATEEDFRRLFRLDWNAETIRQALLERGPEIEPYLGSLAGLRLMAPSDPVETFFSFLCTPNNNIARITTMVNALAAYGEPFDDGFNRFPSAEVIAEIPEAVLREQKFGYRGATIPRAAAELATRGGRAYLDSLKTASYEEAFDALISFPGIGAKLADCIALFALHHTSVIPVDTHIWQAATRLYFPEWREVSMTDLKYKAVSRHLRDRFGEYAGWAQQYLFLDSVLNWRSRTRSV